MTTVLLGIGFVAVFFALMSVRLLFIKNGEFKGTCASQSPYLNKEGVSCSLCGRTVNPGDSCADSDQSSGGGNPDSEVSKVLSKFS